jgi:hypothetical protein
VVVRGGTGAALAAAQSSAWRGVPLIALHGAAEGRAPAVNQAVIAEMAAWQTSEAGGTPFPVRLDLLVHQRLAESAATSAARMFGMTPGRPGCHVAPGLSA